jgi:TIR domain
VKKSLLPPVGFWSYARRDDEFSDGYLTRLRDLIKRELQLQFGREDITLFQDTATIPLGAKWESETFAALSRSTFFIPIITPNFIQSEWCGREVGMFLNREKDLSALYSEPRPKSWIFPIQYRKIREDKARDPEILEALKGRQWCRFQSLRHEDISAKIVREKISEFAESICDLLLTEVDLRSPRGDTKAGRPESETNLRRKRHANAGTGAPEWTPPEEDQEGQGESAAAGPALLRAAGGHAEPLHEHPATRPPEQQSGAAIGGEPTGSRMPPPLSAGHLLLILSPLLVLLIAAVLFGLPEPQDNPAPVSAPLPQARRPGPPSEAAVPAPVSTWLYGRWTPGGNCNVPLVISPMPGGFEIAYLGDRYARTVNRAGSSDRSVATNEETFVRDGQIIRVLERDREMYRLMPCPG